MNKKPVACGVPWCVAVADFPKQYCIHHVHESARVRFPPPVSRELELRYAATTLDGARKFHDEIERFAQRG